MTAPTPESADPFRSLSLPVPRIVSGIDQCVSGCQPCCLFPRPEMKREGPNKTWTPKTINVWNTKLYTYNANLIGDSNGRENVYQFINHQIKVLYRSLDMSENCCPTAAKVRRQPRPPSSNTPKPLVVGLRNMVETTGHWSTSMMISDGIIYIYTSKNICHMIYLIY